MKDIKTKLKVYDTHEGLKWEQNEDYSRFKSLALKVTKATGSNTLIVDLPNHDGGFTTWQYLYRTPHNLYTLYGIRFDQVDLDDCTTLSRELYDWILVRMSRND